MHHPTSVLFFITFLEVKDSPDYRITLLHEARLITKTRCQALGLLESKVEARKETRMRLLRGTPTLWRHATETRRTPTP